MVSNAVQTKRRYRVLVFEEDPACAECIADILKKADCKDAHLVKTKKEALAAIKSRQLDVMLVNLFAKGKPVGLSLVGEAYRKNYRIPPVIYMLNDMTSSLLTEANAHSPKSYIMQDLDVRELDNALIGAVQSTNSYGSYSSQQCSGHLLVKKDSAVVHLSFDDLYSVGVNGKYSLLNTRKGAFLIQKSLKEMEVLLPSSAFSRIHSNYLVNMGFVDAMREGEKCVVLKNGHEVPYSSRMKSRLFKLLSS